VSAIVLSQVHAAQERQYPRAQALARDRMEVTKRLHQPTAVLGPTAALKSGKVTFIDGGAVVPGNFFIGQYVAPGHEQ